MTGLAISSHLVDRWVERVNPTADRPTAGAEILSLVARGRRSSRPPRWAGYSYTGTSAGTTFVSSPAWPGVVLVVARSGSAVTVLARRQFANAPGARLAALSGSSALQGVD